MNHQVATLAVGCGDARYTQKQKATNSEEQKEGPDVIINSRPNSNERSETQFNGPTVDIVS
jgi:hypothetical protein